MKCINYFFIVLLALSPPGRGSEWFVASDASYVSGTGSKSQPWQLQVAFTNTLPQPGDLISLRGGTYFPTTTNAGFSRRGKVDLLVDRESTNLITLKSYRNEWAKIDRPINFGEFTGINLRFRDLEFYDSLKGLHPTNIAYPVGPWNHFDSRNSGQVGTGNEWINCLIHDVNNCWAYETSIRGCVIWHVGLNQLEHVCYPVGLNFIGNISAWHSHEVINQFLATSNTIVIRSNICFGASQSTGAPTFRRGGFSGRLGKLRSFI